MTALDLYALAERDHIEILDCPSLSRDGVSALLADGSCVIGLKTHRTGVLAHELGHCELLAFYDASSPYEARGRAETKAQKWAIQHVIPSGELEAQIADGRSLWEIAEHFDVDERMVISAICLYRYNHL